MDRSRSTASALPIQARTGSAWSSIGWISRCARVEFVALLGPSGCGKTTLLHLIAGLDTNFQGRIRWSGTGDGQRPSLGYVFQNPRLLPWLTLRDNIALVLDPVARRDGRIEDLLDAMGLIEAADVHANRLSVGMQRRGALARAFAVRPLCC